MGIDDVNDGRRTNFRVSSGWTESHNGTPKRGKGWIVNSAFNHAMGAKQMTGKTLNGKLLGAVLAFTGSAVWLVTPQAVLGQDEILIEEGIATTLAEAGLLGPDSPHAGFHPEGDFFEFDMSDGGGVNHSLLWFDIPPDVITGFGNGTATLLLTVANNGNVGNIHRVTEDWVSTLGEDVTWNDMPGGPGLAEGVNVADEVTAEFPESFGREQEAIEIDVSADVQAWGTGAGNYGWGIIPTGNDGTSLYDFNDLDRAPMLLLVPGEGGGQFLNAGDANRDLKFDQLDLVQVQISAKYLTGNPATWGEGDWNAAPGGTVDSPPPGDGQFNQIDIIAALNAGVYLTGPYAALQPEGGGGGNASITYNPGTGEVGVQVGATQLTSINIDSAASIFTGDAAMNLGGSFDNDADNNIFKATFGSSFGSLSFGNVAQSGLSEETVRNDLTVIGSLAGGGDLGAVDLIYVPEPSALVLVALGMAGIFSWVWRRNQESE
jgi:hypothetical protein